MPIYKMNKVKDGKSQYKVVVCYTDTLGNHRQTSRTVYGAAEAKAKEQELTLEVGSVQSTLITVEELFKQYKEAKKHELRLTTLDRNISILNRYVLNTSLKTKAVSKLTLPIMQEWKNKIGENNLSVRTKNNVLATFKAFLNYAVQMEYIPKNPLSKIAKFKDDNFVKPKDKIQFYTIDEFRKYIKAAEQSRQTLLDYGCVVFFYIAFLTGMRKGEINALKWSDIDGDIIHVRRSVAQKIKGTIQETAPKNKSSYRDLKMPDNLKNILEEHKQLLIKHTKFNEDMRVCGGIKVIPDTTLDIKNRLYAELAGLPRIRIHDFRHSHATLLCNQGINIQEVSRRLGHTDVSMTWNTYSHLYPQAEEQALKILNTV